MDDTRKCEIILKGRRGVKGSCKVLQGYYIDLRKEKINPEDMPPPEFNYAYDCRHGGGGDWCTPKSIEKRVVVNHAGTFFSNVPLDLGADGWLGVKDFYYTEW